MKYIPKILSSTLFAILFTSCDVNNVFDDLGTTDGNVVANVYLQTLAPKLPAGIDKKMEAQYWSLDDKFSYTGLWDYIRQQDEFEVSVDGIKFTDDEFNDFQDWAEYEEHPFDFSNWRPDSSAYIMTINYLIDQAYDEVSVGAGDITITEFLTQAPDTYEDDMYKFYTTALSRTTLNDLMVNNGIMTQEEFDAQYGENGALTESGKVAIQDGLEQIGIETLVGSNYNIVTKYEITLAFRVTNSTSKYNESKRTFGVF